MMDEKAGLILELKQVPILERGDWRLIYPKFIVTRTTRKAAEVGGMWIPKSQLRGDVDGGHLFVSTWWWNKESLGSNLKGGTNG